MSKNDNTVGAVVSWTSDFGEDTPERQALRRRVCDAVQATIDQQHKDRKLDVTTSLEVVGCDFAATLTCRLETGETVTLLVPLAEQEKVNRALLSGETNRLGRVQEWEKSQPLTKKDE